MVGEKKPQHLEKRSENLRRQGNLLDKVALVTGGDSGMGRAVSIFFAQEGADVAIVCLNEHEDVENTRQRVERLGRRCITIAGHLGHPDFCKLAVTRTIETFGRLDVLVNNAAELDTCHSILEVSSRISSEPSQITSSPCSMLSSRPGPSE